MFAPRYVVRSVLHLELVAVLAVALLSACGSPLPQQPQTTSEASTGDCPVTIDVPSAGEATGEYIQISVSQSCTNWTNAMIAYIDGQRCDESPYPYPNEGCKTTGDVQNFSKSTWLRVTPGTHKINVNNWNTSGKVGVSSVVSFTYTPVMPADAGKDGPADARGDADASLPPGTVRVSNLEAYMFKIANGGADHCTSVDGHDLCAGSCNGTCAGTKGLSTYSIETGIKSPAFGPSSTGVDVSGERTDTLEWVKIDPAKKGAGAYTDDTHFSWDFYFYPTTLTDVQAYEFDAFFSANGWWLMMGTQCDLASGNWNGWNQATGHWVPSAIEGCGSFFELNAWNHVTIRFHRDAGPVDGSTHYYYDDLVVNGVSHTWGLGGFTGTNNGWGDVVGAQVQQDLASYDGTLSTYYDAFTFEISP
jgi:hypothetical protein